MAKVPKISLIDALRMLRGGRKHELPIGAQISRNSGPLPADEAAACVQWASAAAQESRFDDIVMFAWLLRFSHYSDGGHNWLAYMRDHVCGGDNAETLRVYRGMQAADPPVHAEVNTFWLELDFPVGEGTTLPEIRAKLLECFADGVDNSDREQRTIAGIAASVLHGEDARVLTAEDAVRILAADHHCMGPLLPIPAA